jgi:hypothetical protein
MKDKLNFSEQYNTSEKRAQLLQSEKEELAVAAEQVKF